MFELLVATWLQTYGGLPEFNNAMVQAPFVSQPIPVPDPARVKPNPPPQIPQDPEKKEQPLITIEE